MSLANFERSIGYSFNNIELLKEALTHTSYAYDNNVNSNERLEYLGDSILEFVISEHLYTNYTRLSEGEMTKVRANVVCEDSLFVIAKRHNFSDFLFLGRSEKNSQNSKKAILADSVEAVIAAIFLDSNLDNAKKFILDNLRDTVEFASRHVGVKDYKTVLQEKLQVHGDVRIEYRVLREEGPDHDKFFVVEVCCDGKKLAEGKGHNKKLAEMEAAKSALERYQSF